MELRNVKFGLSDNDLVSVLNTYNFKKKTPKKMVFYHGTSVGAGSPIVRTWGDKTRGRKCEEEGHGQGFIIKFEVLMIWS
jgi:hypothetical protein